SPLVPAKLGFTTQASGASDGRPFVVQPVMLVQDVSGQTVTTDNTTQVTLNVSSGASTIGTITRTAVNGVVTFTNVGIDGLPNTNYTLTYTSSGLAPATQPIYLNPGLATHLNLSIPAAGATVGNAFTTQPVLQILDAFNQIVTTDNTSLVTMQVTSGATIIGASSATAKNGIVTFGNVGLTGNTGNYTLSFVSTPLVPAHQNIVLAPFMPLVTGSSTSTPGLPGVSTVNLYDPQTGQQTGTVEPFPGFTGEIRVGTGDFDGDGRFEIVAAAGPGGGPAVIIMDSTTGNPKAAFFAYDPAFSGGVFVAVKDVNNDGVADIITGAGAGGGPHVKIFNGVNLQIVQSFFAYAPDFTGGVTVATADINGDQVFDVVTGAGAGGGPHVKVFDGATNNLISSWFAYPVDFKGGVFV
ncbi:MAG: FG-GAP-like repeat-containing protein, partial [Gemmataceae bacterium]